MKIELPEIRPEERTPLVEALLAIIQFLLDRNQQLEETVLQLRDEIAILKGKLVPRRKTLRSVRARRNVPRTANLPFTVPCPWTSTLFRAEPP